MKIALGILCLVGGAALGLWLGVWVCFIGGLVKVAGAVHPFNGPAMALGLLRFICSPFVGWGTFATCCGLSAICFTPRRQAGLRR